MPSPLGTRTRQAHLQVRQVQHLLEDHQMKKISERAARLTIAMMRSMANCKPISPFHLEASKEMEAMLEELIALRKKLKEKQ
jgi:uncharacterized membrane protein